MEDKLAEAGLLHPLPLSSFSDIQSLEFHYRSIENSEAWLDFIGRINQLHKTTIQQIINGTLDKYGKQHDDEYRAVLLCLDRLLTFRASITAQYDTLKKKQDELIKRANEREDIHTRDIMATAGQSSSWGRRQF